MLTDAQKQIRLGKFNASTVEALMKPKGIGKGGLTYILEKLSEQKTGLIKEIPVTKSMQWGIDNEDSAIERLSNVLNIPMQKNEISLKDTTYNLTGTPDVLISTIDEKTGLTINTGAEIKCPNSETHIEYATMTNGSDLREIEPKYYWQIVSYMLLTNYDSWFFITYDPRIIEEKQQMYVFIINRNESDVDLLKSRLIEANNILEEKKCKL